MFPAELFRFGQDQPGQLAIFLRRGELVAERRLPHPQGALPGGAPVLDILQLLPGGLDLLFERPVIGAGFGNRIEAQAADGRGAVDGRHLERSGVGNRRQGERGAAGADGDTAHFGDDGAGRENQHLDRLGQQGCRQQGQQNQGRKDYAFHIICSCLFDVRRTAGPKEGGRLFASRTVFLAAYAYCCCSCSSLLKQ